MSPSLMSAPISHKGMWSCWSSLERHFPQWEYIILIVYPHCSALSIPWYPSIGVRGHKPPAQKDHSLCCDQQAHTSLEVTVAQNTIPGVRQKRSSWKQSPDSKGSPSPCRPQLWYSPKSPASSSTLNISQCPLHVSRGTTVRVSCPLPTAKRLCRL